MNESDKEKIEEIARIGNCMQELRAQLYPMLEGKSLLSLRRTAGLTQEGAARKCGVTLRTWVRWEKCKNSPRTPKPFIVLCTYIQKQSRERTERAMASATE